MSSLLRQQLSPMSPLNWHVEMQRSSMFTPYLSRAVAAEAFSSEGQQSANSCHSQRPPFGLKRQEGKLGLAGPLT